MALAVYHARIVVNGTKDPFANLVPSQRNPKTGIQNVAIHRWQVNGQGRQAALLNPETKGDFR
ncbi:MAG: hypothetical protein JO232_04810 [Verrucomicrobia bacterium]|nr:hypothetical protein [Verrucomicrobiota bacterium]